MYYLCIVLLLNVVRCQGQEIDVNSNISTTTVQTMQYPELPKCCESKNERLVGRTCELVNEQPSYRHWYFDSNITHINTEKVEFDPTFYNQSLTCPMYQLEAYEFLGFNFNGSVIVPNTEKLIESQDYCVDSNDNGTIRINVCYYESSARILKGQIYMSVCMVVSMLCYFGSAYYYIELYKKRREMHKKIFAIYFLNMGSTFLFLIFLQSMEDGCIFFGMVFFLLVLSSYVWFSCSCLDMVYISNSDSKVNTLKRFRMYIAVSIAIPLLLLLISVLPTGTINLPKSFLKGPKMCFVEDTSRMSILFVPMGIALLFSAGTLAFTSYIIEKNDGNCDKDTRWSDNITKQLKYIRNQNVAISVTMSVFFILALLFSLISDEEILRSGPILALEIIDSLQGLLILIVFVIHYKQGNSHIKRCEDTIEGDDADDASPLSSFKNGNISPSADEELSR